MSTVAWDEAAGGFNLPARPCTDPSVFRRERERIIHRSQKAARSAPITAGSSVRPCRAPATISAKARQEILAAWSPRPWLSD